MSMSFGQPPFARCQRRRFSPTRAASPVEKKDVGFPRSGRRERTPATRLRPRAARVSARPSPARGGGRPERGGEIGDDPAELLGDEAAEERASRGREVRPVERAVLLRDAERGDLRGAHPVDGLDGEPVEVEERDAALEGDGAGGVGVEAEVRPHAARLVDVAPRERRSGGRDAPRRRAPRRPSGPGSRGRS